MEESRHIQAIEKIYSKVDKSKTELALSIHCIEAQSVLINKLIKRAAQQTEICNLISNGNIKQEIEIKFAEQEINNLRISLVTIKSGNIELRKELLMKKELKSEILKRIELGEQKYEILWQSSKNRYESIPFVQKYLQGKNKIEIIERKLNDLRNESVKLIDNINNKRNALINIEKKLVVDLANFLVNEHPKVVKMINDKIIEIQELAKKANSLEEQTILNNQFSKLESTVIIKNNPRTEKTTHCVLKADDSLTKKNDEILMPKLHLLGVDFDFLRVKLEQIKKDDFRTEKCKASITEPNKTNDLRCDISDESSLVNYINTGIFSNQFKNKNYSKRKLIHILDDVELDKNQSRKIISKVNPFQLCKVNFITSEANKFALSYENKVNGSPENKSKIVLNTENEILMPPTQFLDEKKNSQEKTKVTFEKEMEAINDEYAGQHNHSNEVTIEDIKSDEAINSQNDNSITVEDQNEIKDKILKEQKLDSSPQFVYAKHSTLQKKPENEVVISKFFNSKRDDIGKNNVKVEAIEKTQEMMQEHNKVIDSSKLNEINISTKKINQDVHKMEMPVTGFLFSHGAQGILDSSNLSDSTTGFQDGDFPHCLNSSIFLSPKVDVSSEIENDKIQNECQLPNFISGVRKSESLFRWSSDDCKPSTSSEEKAKENFNFNFNSNEKKKRGGLFNMFHN